ncbi:putative ribonuclease III [Helianthus annuus]|nr:putative ribonuclease III [Helianthus annuus]KAJ0508500.1 putative ribonuclease III [Helianthus annuus]KAJ0516753.1 putative ribonuclease III [Helianthus annuus]KAJ0684755.1 putative ribonuclease III [Helianthus annuus]
MKKRGFNNNKKPTNHRSSKRKTHPQEKIIHTYGTDLCLQPSTQPVQQSITIEDSIAAVESILSYSFKNKRLLEEALTHSSCTDGLSYQRLEFLGDAVIAQMISNYFFLKYPDVDAGILSRLRAANVSNEKLARVAVNHGLHKYVRHNKATVLNDKVFEFLIEVGEEDMVVYGGQMKAPKVLADIVESVAAAVYVDCRFNLQDTWMIFGHLLEPLVMLDDILAEPQPITALYEACQKDGKQLDIQYRRNGDKTVASVYMDGILIVSRSSDTKENAKLHAAEAALLKITKPKTSDTGPQAIVDFNDALEIEGAKQKLNELCNKQKWPKPTYKVEKELGPSHDRRYISSVQVEIPDATLSAKGNERSKVKDAENSAASVMLEDLLKAGYT